MRLVINLDNPLVFQQVVVPMPTDEEISWELYENARRRTRCTKQKEITRFIGQWNNLIDRFADILQTEIEKDLYHFDDPPDYYSSLADRLKRGISESILNRNDGLLQRQQSTVFVELKSFLESICIYCIRNPGTARTQTLLNNLYERLNVCGPGLFTHIMQGFYELYQPQENLCYWLADFREIILKEWARQYWDQNEIDPVFHAHVYTAFSNHAKNNQWHLLQENNTLDDTFVTTVIPSSRKALVYAEFEQYFKQKYKTETIDYLSERLTHFMTAQFNEHAIEHTLSSENNDQFQQFFTNVSPVLDSFKLSMHFFLSDVSTDDCVKYRLKGGALRLMKYYIAIAMHNLNMLDSDPLILLREISNQSSNSHTIVSQHFVDAVSSEKWLHAFRCAFDANAPQELPSRSRRRIEGPQLFRSTTAFERLLRSFNCSPSTASTEVQLGLILSSNAFSEFMTNILGMSQTVCNYFRHKYEAVEEKKVPAFISTQP